MKARAVILEKCNFDVSGAEVYGDLVYVFPQGEGRSSIWSEAFVQEIKQRLAEMRYDAKVDYFVVAGKMVPLVTMIGVLLELYGHVRVLFYSSTDRYYVPRTLGAHDVEVCEGCPS
jgi:hypothetical protein